MLAFLSIMLMCNLSTSPTEMSFLENPPAIDGVLSANEWDNAYAFPDEFTEVRPDFGKKWEDKTVVRAGYDKDNFYVLFEVHQDTASLVERKGTRDSEIDQDAVAIFLDPLGNKNEYYFISFGLSGTITDLRMMRATLGASEDITWDADVYSAVKKNGFGYTVEAKIPFHNFRRQSGQENLWHVNLWRRKENQNREAMCKPLHALETDAWYDDVLPITLKGICSREKIRITPYGIYGSTFDTVTAQQGNAGFDMKVPMGATGVANFAFNPDFSQLEGDPLQFTFNIQYALYYPEYRPFFVEERSIFETDLDIFYSRTIQNPLLAGRYTYKGKKNQAGILLAYDEADETIENNNAFASIVRYNRIYGRNNAGVMALSRYNMDEHYNNMVLMTDGNLYLPGDIKFTYLLAGTNVIGSDTLDSKDWLSSIGKYYHGFLAFERNNWTILGNFWGISDNFANDLGFIQRTDRDYAGGWIGKKFLFDNKILKRMEIGENFGFFSRWGRFWDNLKSARDSFEYFSMPGISLDLFTQTYVSLMYDATKTYSEGYYLEKGRIRGYNYSKLNKYFSFDFSFALGSDFDFNKLEVGKYNVGVTNVFCTPSPELTLNAGVRYARFYADTTVQALKPSDIETTVRQWTDYSYDVGVSYSPTNNLSFRFIAERLVADFVEEYGLEDVHENKIFSMIEYKPSLGDVIYLGLRYPEKLLFFKFTHRFDI